MDKAKMRKLLSDVDRFAKDLEDSLPKVRSKLNSLRWLLKSAKEELEKPDDVVVPVAAPKQLQAE